MAGCISGISQQIKRMDMGTLNGQLGTGMKDFLKKENSMGKGGIPIQRVHRGSGSGPMASLSNGLEVMAILSQFNQM